MNKYNLIFNTLQSKVNSGELTLEQAEEVNELAYQKYITESVVKKILDSHKKKKEEKLKKIQERQIIMNKLIEEGTALAKKICVEVRESSIKEISNMNSGTKFGAVTDVSMDDYHAFEVTVDYGKNNSSINYDDIMNKIHAVMDKIEKKYSNDMKKYGIKNISDGADMQHDMYISYECDSYCINI